MVQTIYYVWNTSFSVQKIHLEIKKSCHQQIATNDRNRAEIVIIYRFVTY